MKGSLPLDVVLVDTGTTESFSGKLSLERTCGACWHPHGTQMARALEDMAQRLSNLDVISATMLIWREPSLLPSVIRDAADLNPKVIVLALAGSDPSRTEYEAVKYATNRGILVLAAAGNEGRDEPEYPAGYNLKCLVAVSTIKERDQSWNTNRPHGPSRGDLYLPQYTGENGTSFSTARMAAYAIAYFRVYPNANCKTAKTWLIAKFGSAHTDLKLVQDVRSQRQAGH